jgi:hypothetical protein
LVYGVAQPRKTTTTTAMAARPRRRASGYDSARLNPLPYDIFTSPGNIQPNRAKIFMASLNHGGEITGGKVH